MKKRAWLLVGSLLISTPAWAMAPTLVEVVKNETTKEKSMLLREGDNECRVGELLKIELEENPSTGYSWQIDFPRGIEVVSDTFIPSSAGKSDETLHLVGAPGTHQWIITAENPGTYRLKFAKVSPGKKEIVETKEFTIRASEKETMNKNQVRINGKIVEVPGGMIEVKQQTLYPLRYLAEVMGATVEWDKATQTATVHYPLYNQEHQYLSYLSGLTRSKEDESYPLPERTKQLELPPYPLTSGNSSMLHQKPIGITIEDNGFNIPFVAYDYAFRNNQLYVSSDWLNTIFLAETKVDAEGTTITYPTKEELEKALNEIQSVVAPITPEETLALWIRGQQVRSGALQYSSLSPELKKQVLARKQGWVTGGSSPSAGKVTILDKKQKDEETLVYTLGVDEMLQGEVVDQIKQQVTIKKYVIEGQTYWLISEAKGDLSYFTVLPDSPLK